MYLVMRRSAAIAMITINSNEIICIGIPKKVLSGFVGVGSIIDIVTNSIILHNCIPITLSITKCFPQ